MTGNLTSATVFLGMANNLHHIASKGAIAAMTRSLANELGSDGITVNAIAPGMTVTEGIRNNSAYSKEMLDGIVKLRAIRREETPDDLVGTCLRPAYFFQNDMRLQNAILSGTYPIPIGSIGAEMIDVRDIAAVAVLAMLDRAVAGRRKSFG